MNRSLESTWKRPMPVAGSCVAGLGSGRAAWQGGVCGSASARAATALAPSIIEAKPTISLKNEAVSAKFPLPGARGDGLVLRVVDSRLSDRGAPVMASPSAGAPGVMGGERGACVLGGGDGATFDHGGAGRPTLALVGADVACEAFGDGAALAQPQDQVFYGYQQQFDITRSLTG